MSPYITTQVRNAWLLTVNPYESYNLTYRIYKYGSSNTVIVEE